MQAVKFALDIACGMAFLHTLEPMIPRHYLNSKSVMVSMKSTQNKSFLGLNSASIFDEVCRITNQEVYTVVLKCTKRTSEFVSPSSFD